MYKTLVFNLPSPGVRTRKPTHVLVLLSLSSCFDSYMGTNKNGSSEPLLGWMMAGDKGQKENMEEREFMHHALSQHHFGGLERTKETTFKRIQQDYSDSLSTTWIMFHYPSLRCFL